MLLGEYEHALDDKNRLILPARFRQSFAAGVVLARGMDGCLVVYTRDGWERFVEQRLAGLDPLSREARQMSRFVFAGASEAELDKQGRVMVPPAARRAREAQPRSRGRRGSRSPRDLGPRRLAHSNSKRSKGVLSLLQNASQQSKTDHVPVLADEVRELLDVSPGETVVDATFGAGGHAAALAADLEGKGRFIAIDRDPTVRPYFERFQRRCHGVQTRFLRGDFDVVMAQLAQNDVQADAVLLDLGVSSMQIDRPERGFSYAVDAPLDMRMDPSGRALRERGRERGRRARARRRVQTLRRGAVLPPDSRCDRPAPA